MNEIYIVDGVKYNVGPNRKEEFLKKFPNAQLDQPAPGKTQPTTQKSAEDVDVTAALDTDLPSVDTSLDSQKDEPNILESLAARTARGFTSTFKGLQAIPENIIFGFGSIGMDANEKKAFRSAIARGIPGTTSTMTTGQFDTLIDDINEHVRKTESESVTDAISKGNIAEAAELTVGGALESMPSILAAMTGYGGIALFGSSVAGNKFDEEFKNDPMRSTGILAANAIGSGAIEATFELATRGLLKQFGIVGAKSGKDAAKKLLEEGVSSFIKKAGVAYTKEAGSEAATELTQILFDKATLNKDVDLGEAFTRVADAGIIGGFMGGTISTVAQIGDTNTAARNRAEYILMPEAEKQKIKASAAKISNLAIDLEAAEGDAAEIIKKEIIKEEDIIIEAKKNNSSNLSLLESDQLKKYASNVDNINKKRNIKGPDSALELAEIEINNLLKENQQIIELAKEQRLQKSTEFAEKVGAKIGKTTRILTNEEAISEFGEDVEGADGFIVGNEIIINKDVASQASAVTVGSHEILHPILESALKGKNQQEIINQFKETIGKEQLAIVERRLNKSYSADYIAKNQDEYFTVFSDAILKGEIKYNDNIFTKLGDLIRPILRKFGFSKIEFNTGRDVYNFLKDYNKSVAKGDVSQEIVDIAKDTDTEIKKFSKTGQDIQKIYDEQGVSGAMEIIEAYKPLTTKITNKYRDVPGFDFELLQSEIEIGQRGLLDLIQAYTPDKGATLNTYIQGQLGKRAIEAANRILDTEFTLDVTEAKGVTDTTTEEVTERVEEDKPAEKVSLRKQLGLDETIKPTVVNAVKKTFGTRLPEVTSKEFRPELEKRFRTELKKPLAKLMGRTEDFRSFLSNNFKTLYDALPQSVVNKRFREFAEPVLGKDGKPLREKTAVGKGIFKKKNIVKAEWIKHFLGDNVGRSTQGTRKTALAEALAEQFAFDATMEVLNDPEVMGKVKEIGELIQQPVPENMIEEVSRIIDRPIQFKFSKSTLPVNANEKAESKLDRQFRLYDKQGRKGVLEVTLLERGFKDSDLIRIKDTESLQKFIDKLPILLKIIPDKKLAKSLLFKSDRVLDVKNKDFYNNIYKPAVEEILEKTSFNDFGFDNYTYSPYKTSIGQTAQKIQEAWENGKIEKLNKRNVGVGKKMWTIVAKEISKDRSTTPIFEWYFRLAANNMEHPHRQMAEMVGWSTNPKGEIKKNGKIKLYDWEHAMPSAGAAAYLLDSALDQNRNFEQDINAVLNNYKLIALDAADHASLNKTFLKAQMPIGWKVFSGSYLERYFNPVLFKAFGGIDPSGIMLTNGKTIKQQFRIEADGAIYDVQPQLSNIKYSKSLDTEFNQLLQATTGIEYYKEFSPAKARLVGRGKGKRKFFIPYSADDFVGLLYATLGKGSVGDKQMAWYEENLLRPFSRGIQQYEIAKQKAMREWMALSNQIKKDVPGGLNKRNETGFRNQDSLRMYIWAKQGMDVPGAAKSDINESVSLVNNNPKLKEFAERLIALNPEGYPAPGQSWDAGDITTDIVSYVNDVRRGEFLTEWKQNVDQIFTDKNKQKLLASYGQNYVDALEDILHRMKTGRNRKFGITKAERTFMDWTNNSVGAIMFFNARSAVLQTLSAVNFINFSDNNPINAGLAFANQPQYWKDFATLFNSDFLKQRRTGLQTDVNADEIANAAKSSTNKAKAALSAILKLGFTPTQIADSFAIASGGATFYRNRVKKYIKEGLDKEAAEKKAFTDFQEVAEETQQSARPDRISMQQASSLGRIILAFGNTPMQYARLTKKAALDLINGRGDWKTNISKIAYYSVIQNIIFSALQQGLFALLFDEEDEEKEKSRYFRIGNSSIDTLLRGSGVYGAAAATVKNMILEIIEQSEKSRPDYTKVAIEATTLSPPINSKLRKLESAGKTFTYKQSKEKVFTEGFSFENPAFLAGGRVISAVANIPVDRVVQKADHIHTAMQDETELWQAIALSLGWSEWDLNMIEKQTKKSPSKVKTKLKTKTKTKTKFKK